MPTKLVPGSDFHRLAAAGRARGVGVYRVSTVKPRAFEDGSRRVRYCFSDETVDRMGDAISVDGWDLDDFGRNPIILFSHDSSAPPIGRGSNVGVVGARLMGTIEFAPPETYEFADTIYKLVVGGWLNACSVGFLPTKYSFVENDPARRGGISFERQILLECSCVPIPANSNALAEARSFGIDTRPLSRWAGRSLDEGTSILSRPSLIRLREQAREPARVTNLSAHRRERDLARADAIAARHPRSRERDLAKVALLRAQLGIPEPASAAEAYAAQEEERRRDRAAAGDVVLRLAGTW